MKPLCCGLAVAGMLAWFASAEALVAKPPVKKAGIELKVTAPEKVTIDYASKTAKEYKQMLEDLQAQAKKGGDLKLPAAPKIDLTLEFTNTSDKDMTLYVGGDYTLGLDLKGPAPITIRENVAYTDDIKRPTPVQLAAGKSHKISITAMQCGFRGYGSKVYWAEAGDYTLTVSYSTRGEGADSNSFTSAPVKIKVVEADKKEPGVKPGIQIQPVPIRPMIQPLPIKRPAIMPVPPVGDPVRDKEPVKKSPLELSIEAPKGGDTFKINAKETGELKKELDEILEDLKNKKTRGKIPAAPAVDFTLVIKNTSDKDVDIYVGGDGSRITLKLDGPGAVSAPYLVFQTADFRLSKKVTVEAGKTHTLNLKSLEFGPRGVGNRLYWTKTGDYTLTAEWQLGGAEGAPGSKLTSSPLKIKVEEAK